MTQLRKTTKRVTIIILAGLALLFIYSILVNIFQKTPFVEILLNISGEFIGGMIVFIWLDQGIRKIEMLHSGIQDVNRLPLDEYILSIKKTRSKVFIYDIYLDSVFENQVGKEFEKAIENTVKDRNVDVRILITNPESDAANKRAEELSQNSGSKKEASQYLSDMRINFRRLEGMFNVSKEASETNRGKLSVKVTSTYARFSMYSWDDDAFWSFHSAGEPSTKGGQLKIPLDHKLGKMLVKEFEEAWEDKDSISIEKIKLQA